MPRAMSRTNGRPGPTPKPKKPLRPPGSISIVKRNEIVKSFEDLNDNDTLEILERVGAGSKYFTCYMCGKIKKADDFYKSTDANIQTGITRICKDCCSDIVYGTHDGEKNIPTKETLFNVLEYLDKPYIENLFSSAELRAEADAEGGKMPDFWKYYITTVNMPAHRTERWRDSEGLKKTYLTLGTSLRPEAIRVEESPDQQRENRERYEINKRDTIKFCGYDPFASYPIESDKPRLYAQIVNFLDDESKSDGLKLAAIIQIVKRLNQAEKLNEQIDFLLNDTNNVTANQALINKMMDTSKKNMDIATNLARDNGISVNYNNNKSAGQQTLSGKIKKLTEEGLREAKVNMFDIGSCEGMRQVAELSEAARHKQIGYDENIAQEIKDIKVELVEQLTRERDEAVEARRLLIRENKDLKEFLRERGLIDEHNVAYDVPVTVNGEP